MQYVIAKVWKLKSLVVSIYRPRDTRDSAWKDALNRLSEDISLAQSNGDFERIIFGGNLNFGSLKWDELGNIQCGCGLNSQMSEFAKIISENHMKNLIDKPKR